MADDKNRQEEANRAELGRRKAATRGTRQQTGNSNAVSANGMSARSMLSLNKGRDNKTSTEEKVRAEAGKQVGGAVGAAVGSYIPIAGTAVGRQVGAFVGKKVAKSWVGKIIFWGILFLLFFMFFVLAATVVAVICNTGTVGRWAAWGVGVTLPACKL
jgi:hypothetical protein